VCGGGNLVYCLCISKCINMCVSICMYVCMYTYIYIHRRAAAKLDRNFLVGSGGRGGNMVVVCVVGETWYSVYV